MINILAKYLNSTQYLNHKKYKKYCEPIYKALDNFLVSTYNALNNKNIEQYAVKESMHTKTAKLTTGKIGLITLQEGTKDQWTI